MTNSMRANDVHFRSIDMRQHACELIRELQGVLVTATLSGWIKTVFEIGDCRYTML